MIAARANDGSSPAAFYLPSATAPGVWRPTPSCSAAGGAFYQFRNMAPFGIRSTDQFRLGPPPPLPSVRYARTFDEVKAVGSTNSAQRPPDRAVDSRTGPEPARVAAALALLPGVMSEGEIRSGSRCIGLGDPCQWEAPRALAVGVAPMDRLAGPDSGRGRAPSGGLGFRAPMSPRGRSRPPA